MPNIGDRLEEARKRQGISIREAAEATKIRSDFLLNFENNQFDFNLPEVYRRGFLKLYGRYLKLDEDKLMTDYNAILLGSNKANKRESREFFGRMDLPAEEPKTTATVDTTPAGDNDSGLQLRERPASSGYDAPASPVEQKTDSSLYWKVGLVIAGTFVILALLAMLMNALISPEPVESDMGDTPDETASISDTTDPTASPGSMATGDATAADVPQLGTVKIIANGDTRVIVRQEKDGTKLFSGPLAAGESVDIERDGIIRVVSPEIENVTVEIDGERYKSNQTGLRQSWYGMEGPVPPPSG